MAATGFERSPNKDQTSNGFDTYQVPSKVCVRYDLLVSPSFSEDSVVVVIIWRFLEYNRKVRWHVVKKLARSVDLPNSWAPEAPCRRVWKAWNAGHVEAGPTRIRNARTYSETIKVRASSDVLIIHIYEISFFRE